MARERDGRYQDRLTDFALRLRELRHEAGLTQDTLAERAGLSVTMVQNLERPSDGGNPRLSTLLALADALSIQVADLVAGPIREQGQGSRPGSRVRLSGGR